MVYNPELVKQILGEEVSKLFDGTIKIEPSKGEKIFGLTVGDKVIFTFKNITPIRQFIVTAGKK